MTRKTVKIIILLTTACFVSVKKHVLLNTHFLKLLSR